MATYRIEKVRVGDVNVDLYQRDEKPSHINNIAKSFDEDALGVPTISIRDNKKYALDGQQRVAALKQKFGDNHMVEAKVFRGLTREREVELFLKLNNSRSVTPLERFNTRLEKKERKAISILKLIEQSGYTIQRPRMSTGITGIVALEEMYDKDPKSLQWSLDFIRSTWTFEKRPNAYLIVGLAALHRQGLNGVTVPNLRKAFMEVANNTGDLKRKAQVYATNEYGGRGRTDESTGMFVGKGLYLLYNDHRPARARLFYWKTSK